MALELIIPYLVVAFISKLGNSVFHEVKELDVYQVDVYDPANIEPCRDQYLVYVHFDPAAKRGYSSEPEWVAERLTRLDESESPGIISRLRFYAKRVTLDVDSLEGGPHSLGAGIALWIGHSPGWSRLRNRSLVQLQILRIQSEVRVQSQTARYSPTKR